jgi:hypothetical protein
MHGCCNKVIQASHSEIITVDNHKFCATIRYCKTCGQVKAQSHITEAKNDN